MNPSVPLIRRGWIRAAIFLLVWIFIQVAAGSIVLMITKSTGQVAAAKELTFNLLAFALVNLVTSFTAVYIFRTYIDRSTLSSLGFKWKNYSNHAWSGFFAALLILSAGSLVLMTTGNLTFIGFDVFPKDLFIYFLIMLLVAFSEEVVIRGYILNNLLQSTNKWLALVVSSALFAIFHFANPDFNLFGMLGIFFGGLLIGINYIYTKNLWYCIFFHFSWNFFQGPVFGFKVSGIETDSLLAQNINGANWFTGGPFGFEASALSCFFLFITTVILGFYYRKNQHAFQTGQS